MLRHKTKQYIHLLLFFGLMCMLSACGKKETVQNEPEIAGQSSVQDDVKEPASVTDDNDTAQEPQNPENDTTQPPDGQADDRKDRDDRKDKDNGDSQQADTSVDDVQQENTQEKPEEAFTKKRYASTNVYLRTEASRESKDLALLSKGSVVYEGSQEDGWSHVKDKAGQEGYVYSQYLTDKKPVKTRKKKTPKNSGAQSTNGKVVVIDPGHQQHANSEVEPLGPGSSEMKAKETGGTSGVATGMAEYQLNLDVSKKLRDELQRRGYEVIMVRETNDVDMGNIDRAEVANNAKADAFVRIHANGSENSSATGMMTICQTASNPYNGYLYQQSKKLAGDILDCAVAVTGAVKEYVWETDSMCGINWSEVPVTIFEMGYMSNPAEDVLLSQGDYQDKIACGVADGIERFLTEP